VTSSDELVDALQPYGVVTIFQHDNKTFRARADLFMHGMKAEVTSDFGHPTMLSALQELHDRVMPLVVQPEDSVRRVARLQSDGGNDD